MRTTDRRTRVSRRVFLRTTAAAVPAAAVASAGISITGAWAEDAKTLAPHVMQTLAKTARDIYPHDYLADIFYIRAVMPWDAKAAKDPKVRQTLEEGVAQLDQAARDSSGVTYIEIIPEADRLVLLRKIEPSPFFRTLRADLVVSIYNQPEVWAKFGYEGSSAEYGGYLNRGFNDIDWLAET